MTPDPVDMIRKELLEDDQDVRSQFLKHFTDETSEFISEMTKTYSSWKTYEATVGTDMRRVYVTAFFFNAFNNLLVSTKLLLSGYSVPSGNLVRQTIEAICTAILCSAKKLTVYEQITRNKFSSNDAGRLVLKHRKTLNIEKKAMESLLRLHKFYHHFSHPSLIGLAQNISLSSSDHSVYLGASFDKEKLSGYRKEVSARVELALLISKAIDGLVES